MHESEDNGLCRCMSMSMGFDYFCSLILRNGFVVQGIPARTNGTFGQGIGD